jgi:hypothetical protein
MDRSVKIAVAFLILFSLPFCVFGTLAVVKGITQIVGGGPSQAWMLVALGMIFSAIGFGLLATVIYGPRKMKEAQQRQQSNPDQPWLWRVDWAQGRANSKTKSEMVRAWIFSILWNLISAPILFVVPKEQLEKQPISLIAVGFPLIGIAMLVWAFRETLRWFEFGKTCFEMTSVPCVIGREVRGAIQTHFARPPSHPVHLTLTCINRIVSGSGRDQTTQEKIVWREEKDVSPEQVAPGPTGTSIPVWFHLPVDARQTDSSSPRNSILWQLEAEVDVPGVDYEDIFELPVFRTKDTPNSESAETMAAEATPPHDFVPTISVRNSPDGRTEFYFPPARNVGFAAGLTTFSALWGGALWFLIAKRAPFIFPLLFGAFELLMLYGSLQLWLGTSRVLIGTNELQVRSGILGSGRTLTISFGEIAKIQTAITAQQGGASGTPYYDIQLVQTTGLQVTLGKTIRNKHEAEALAAQMQSLIFGDAKAMSTYAGR